MQVRIRLGDLVLFLVALLGPAFYLLGLWTRGLALFYADYARMGLAYGVLAFSAAAAAYLVLRRGAVAGRVAAGVALLLNLGSLAYAGNRWSRDMQRALTDAAMAPIESGKLGILVSSAEQGSPARAEMEAVEALLNDTFRQTGLAPYIVVRRVYSITSEEQAQRIAQRLRANIVVWRSEYGPDPSLCDRHVTVLGANETAIDMEPHNLMLFMATQGTFRVRGPVSRENGGLSSIATRAIAPVAAGFGALAVGQPLIAGAHFQNVLKSGVVTESVSVLHGYLGTALLLAQRPDLALEEYEAALKVGPNAYAWLGKGNAYLMRRDFQLAMDAYQRAQALDPYSPIPYCGLGIILGRERSVARALACYRQALALEPERSVLYAFLALGFELEGNANAAREAYQACARYAGPNVGLQMAALHRAEDVARHPPTAVPTATIPPLPTPTPVPTQAIYRVQRGETLKAIADKLGVTVEALIEVNQLDNPDTLRIGQLLIIPKKP